MLYTYIYALERFRVLVSDFLRRVWQRCNSLAIDGDTGSASGSYPPSESASVKRLVTSRPGVSARMHSVGIPVSDSQSHLYGFHSLGSVVVMVATAANPSATVLKTKPCSERNRLTSTLKHVPVLFSFLFSYLVSSLHFTTKHPAKQSYLRFVITKIKHLPGPSF
jgi:hypothetical protein